MTRPIWVGVDGGGTRTRVLVAADDGEELGRGEGPGSLADPSRPEVAARRVADVVRQAAGDAGASLPAEGLWAALAGAGPQRTRAGVRAELARLGLARRIGVGTDVEAIFHDAFPGGPGIVLVAGTGSVAWGRSEDGREARVGGWGSVVGDEGSGYRIGVAGLRAIVRGADGRGPDTGLRAPLMATLGLDDEQALAAWAGSASKRELAALAPIVVAGAAGGDAVAGGILRDAVRELASHVLALLETLGPWGDAPVVALGGGLLVKGEPVREELEARLLRHRVRLAPEDPSPLLGAVALARTLG